MRNAIVRTLAEEAASGIDLHFLTGDLGFKVLDPFREAHPDRFTNVGVSEANMLSLAAGMALSGKRPVCYSMVPFLFFRAFESVRLDVVAHRQPVVMVGVGGGLSYGHEGTSHHAIEDVAIARSLPGLQVLLPADPYEAEAAVRLALRHDGPTFIRVGQNGDPKLHPSVPSSLATPLLLREGAGQLVVFASGHIVAAAREACAALESRTGRRATLYSVPSLKPFDSSFVQQAARSAGSIATIEEHSIIGGLGSAVAEALFDARWTGRFERIGLPDAYCELHGTLPWLRKHYRLDPDSLVQRLSELHS